MRTIFMPAGKMPPAKIARSRRVPIEVNYIAREPQLVRRQIRIRYGSSSLTMPRPLRVGRDRALDFPARESQDTADLPRVLPL